jgi:hypothetical protein
VSVVVLAILFALPISSVVCTVLCGAAPSESVIAPATSTDHHGAAMHHHGAAEYSVEGDRPSHRSQLRAVTHHDCGTHDAILRPTSATAERTDSAATSIPLVASAAVGAFNAVIEPGPPLDDSAPRRTPSAAATSSILRV